MPPHGANLTKHNIKFAPCGGTRAKYDAYDCLVGTANPQTVFTVQSLCVQNM